MSNYVVESEVNGHHAYDITWAGGMESGNSAIVGEIARIAAIVRSGQAVRLGCWCSPLPCHGDVVKAAVLWWMENH